MRLCRHDLTPSSIFVPEQGIGWTPRHYAYLKISEGCNNRCTFCIIPKLRGDLVSRPLADVMREAEKLVKAGVKEILVISQDTSGLWRRREIRPERLAGYRISHAIPRSGQGALNTRRVGAHALCLPLPALDEVIPLMAEGFDPAVSRHSVSACAPNVLKAMRRPAHQEKTLARIEAWRAICPDLAIRSTFIVGFPGETDEDFEELLAFLSRAKLERVGAFKYEPVRGATANDLGLPMVPPEVQQRRYDRFMAHQQPISAKLLQRRIGKRIKVIIDEVGPMRGARPFAMGCA